MSTTRIVSGQAYKEVGREPYLRKNGKLTELIVWRSHCAECGEPFEIRTSAKSRRFIPNRRCHLHKQPGVRVKRSVAE